MPIIVMSLDNCSIQLRGITSKNVPRVDSVLNILHKTSMKRSLFFPGHLFHLQPRIPSSRDSFYGLRSYCIKARDVFNSPDFHIRGNTFSAVFPRSFPCFIHINLQAAALLHAPAFPAFFAPKMSRFVLIRPYLTSCCVRLRKIFHNQDTRR